MVVDPGKVTCGVGVAPGVVAVDPGKVTCGVGVALGVVVVDAGKVACGVGVARVGMVVGTTVGCSDGTCVGSIVGASVGDVGDGVGDVVVGVQSVSRTWSAQQRTDAISAVVGVSTHVTSASPLDDPVAISTPLLPHRSRVQHNAVFRSQPDDRATSA